MTELESWLPLRAWTSTSSASVLVNMRAASSPSRGLIAVRNAVLPNAQRWSLAVSKEANKIAGKQLKAIRLKAAGWLVRFYGRSMSCVQHVRYLNWLQRSPLHFEEMRNALKMRAALGDPRLWDGVRREHRPRAGYL